MYLLYPVIHPAPDLPEPELIPGEPHIEYRDTTLFDTVYVDKPIMPDIEETDERKIISIDEPVELFSGAVTFRLWSRDVEVEGIRITNARLHLQETTITITDTLRVPYPVEVHVSRCLFDILGNCIIRDSFATGVIAGLTFVAILIYGWTQVYGR